MLECLRDGCTRPTWNGQPNEFCGRTCKQKAATAPKPVDPDPDPDPDPAGAPSAVDPDPDPAAAPATPAAAPAAPAAAPAAPAAITCKRKGCDKPSWNGKAGEYCGRTCRPPAIFGTQVGEDKFEELKNQFEKKWNLPGKAAPEVKEIWHVAQDKLLEAHEEYAKKIGDVPIRGSGANPGNKQRRFHSTKLSCSAWIGKPCSDGTCPLCNIINNGFDVKYSGKTGSRFGPGLYSSSTPSKAYAYGDSRYQIMVSVVCGVSEYEDKNTGCNTTPLDEGKYHSRVISDTGQGLGGSTGDECIVYHNEAMIPRYLLVFDV